MSFRKRNVVIGASGSNGSSTPAAQRQAKTLAPGSRPSPLDGRLTTSTGTSSLDQLLTGHAGLPLGNSLLVEEAGTTDFGGILLRYFAAEGLVQGHQVHVLGFGDSWRRELPGLSTGDGSKRRAGKDATADDKMKIAWRYGTLGNRSTPARDAKPVAPVDQATAPFCHSFDLAKRLESSAIKGQLHATQALAEGLAAKALQSPFKAFLAEVTSKVKSSPPNTIHRIIVPSLLSPHIYSASACQPRELLQFLHGMRALLRKFPSQVTVMVSMPVSLYPRSSGLTRWAELLFDGVLEMIPMEHRSQMSRDPSQPEDKVQGLLRVHSLPVFHEKGGGLEGSWTREDLSFRLSQSSGVIITPFSLPPVGEDEDSSKKPEPKKESLDF